MTKKDTTPTPEEEITPTIAEIETASYKKDLVVGSIVLGIVVLLVAVIALFINLSTPKLVYEPTNACDAFSIQEATELLGDRAVPTNNQEPVISENTATSKCGYTDGNPNTDELIVAAIMIRSGVNDAGVEQNVSEFSNNEIGATVVAVDDLGDGAFFNEDLGQLNVLNGRDWIILSFGPGSAPAANTAEDAVKLAEKVLN